MSSKYLLTLKIKMLTFAFGFYADTYELKHTYSYTDFACLMDPRYVIQLKLLDTESEHNRHGEFLISLWNLAGTIIKIYSVR